MSTVDISLMALFVLIPIGAVYFIIVGYDYYKSLSVVKKHTQALLKDQEGIMVDIMANKPVDVFSRIAKAMGIRDTNFDIDLYELVVKSVSNTLIQSLDTLYKEKGLTGNKYDRGSPKYVFRKVLEERITDVLNETFTVAEDIMECGRAIDELDTCLSFIRRSKPFPNDVKRIRVSSVELSNDSRI